LSDDLFTDEFRKIPTAKLLARVAQARADGNWRTASPEWWSCIARAKERVVNVVDRYVAKGWIPRDQHGDVVQEALIRGARRLVENLEDLGENAFFAAMVQVAKFQCMDSAEAEMHRQMREKSLDRPASWAEDADEGTSQYQGALDKAARTGWERDFDARELRRQLDQLIPNLKDLRAREIVAADLDGGPTDAEFAEQFDTSVNNIQQIRSRAYKELRGLIDR
jgi:RNA polymerase sigma factor (sigma-70 family)